MLQQGCARESSTAKPVARDELEPTRYHVCRFKQFMEHADNMHQCIADFLNMPSTTRCHQNGCLPFQRQIVHHSLARGLHRC